MLILTPPADAPAGTCTVTPAPEWRHVIDFPFDAFRGGGPGATQSDFIKFTILMCDPTTVYFQDTRKYLFHYEFAMMHLEPFAGYSVQEFNDATLYETGREAILGAIIFPPRGSLLNPPPPIAEYGVQFVSADPLDPQWVVDLYNIVTGAINADPAVLPFYMPTFEQQQSASQNAAFFAQNGITISSPARWTDGNSCYSSGWALGRVVFVPAADINDAFLAGDLRPDDVLLTDGVPADIPIVAGVMSLAPATPNAHTVILANTFQLPFVHLGDPNTAAQAQALVGRRVVLRAYGEVDGFDLGDSCDVRVIDVENELTPLQIDEILQLKAPAPLNIQPIVTSGDYSASTDLLAPTDISRFGGKASNYGLLRRSVPTFSPVALGISMRLWDEFLNQTLPGGLTLRQDIAQRLAPFSYPPADPQALADVLDDIRDMIRDDDDTHFTPAQEAAIIAILQDPAYGFDRNQNIRFRSSTNVEDSEQFTGAGLYDSKSGCLADDLDADEDGPSICDPAESGERGVFRAIRRVFESFYDDNAYLERLRHGVDEYDVGMALLVHHSFPDQFELANGVATLERGGILGDTLRLVTQFGAVSVTNPEGDAVPEEVRGTIHTSGGTTLAFVSPSNLVVLGDTVMIWTTDYQQLASLLRAVADQFELETGKAAFVLDFEYKKLAPGGAAMPAGGIVVKQVRELPQPDDTPTITPFLVNEPTVFHTVGDTPGRIKAEWRVTTKNMWLDAAALANQSIFADVAFRFTDGCEERTVDSTMAALPGATHHHVAAEHRTVDSWTWNDLPNPRAYELAMSNIGIPVSAGTSPIVTIADFQSLNVTIHHATPVPQVPGSSNLVTTDGIPLRRENPIDEFDRNYTLTTPGGVSMVSHYRSPPTPLICGGCAPQVSRFYETTITGLTSEPIVLRDRWSQGYGSSNHAFFEWFVFEPALETQLAPSILDELAAMNARVIRFDINNIDLTGEPITMTLLSDADVGVLCGPCPGNDPGDMTGDGRVDADDIERFVRAVVDAPAGPNETCAADLNGDTIVTGADVAPFVTMLLNE
jgi:hypothetical protein